MTIRAAKQSFLPASTYALGVHLAHAADVAAAENCRAAAELLVAAVYAAFSAESELEVLCSEEVIAA